MKHLILLFLSLSVAASVQAQSRFPYDSVSHEVTYSQTFKFAPKVKEEDVYAAGLLLFANASRFTHKNAIAPLDTVRSKNKNKKETEEQFDNPRPLQMQDPAGGKLQAMGIIRYYTTGSSIKMLYLKYDVGIKVQATSATMTITNIHYFHYNPSSYKQVPVYNFSGGKPCEEVGTLANLIACENFHEEFKNLAQYVNKEMSGHMTDFKELLKQKKYLYDPKGAAAPAKATAKTAGKAPAKTVAKAAVKKP